MLWKKLILITLALISFQNIVISQNLKAVFQKDDKFYYCNLPIGAILDDEGLSWPGTAIATQFCYSDWPWFYDSIASTSLTNCSYAKVFAHNNHRDAWAKCSPKSLRSDGNGGATTICANTNNITCRMRLWTDNFLGHGALWFTFDPKIVMPAGDNPIDMNIIYIDKQCQN